MNVKQLLLLVSLVASFGLRADSDEVTIKNRMRNYAFHVAVYYVPNDPDSGEKITRVGPINKVVEPGETITLSRQSKKRGFARYIFVTQRSRRVEDSPKFLRRFNSIDEMKQSGAFRKMRGGKTGRKKSKFYISEYYPDEGEQLPDHVFEVQQGVYIQITS